MRTRERTDGLPAPTYICGCPAQTFGVEGAEVLWLESGIAAAPEQEMPLGRCGPAIQWQRGQLPAARKQSYLVPCQSPWGTWREASDRSWLRKPSPTCLALRYGVNPANYTGATQATTASLYLNEACDRSSGHFTSISAHRIYLGLCINFCMCLFLTKQKGPSHPEHSIPLTTGE